MFISLQMIVGIGGLEAVSKRRIGVIILVNVVFVMFVICSDLAEQMEVTNELGDAKLETGDFITRLDFSVLVASSVFFANLEHFWGMMEACQEGLRESHYDPSDSDDLCLKYLLAPCNWITHFCCSKQKCL